MRVSQYQIDEKKFYVQMADSTLAKIRLGSARLIPSRLFIGSIKFKSKYYKKLKKIFGFKNPTEINFSIEIESNKPK